MLRKTGIAIVTLGLLYGCASQQAKQPAGVEERTPTAAPAQPAQPSAQPVQPQAVKIDPLHDPNNILSKRSVYFDFDKADIKDQFRPLLQAHAKYLADHADRKVQVQGNCDERGSREYNIALGQRRADAVKRMLVLMGAPERDIETVSFGKEKPRCTEHNEACWSQNRRADILYNGEY